MPVRVVNGGASGPGETRERQDPEVASQDLPAGQAIREFSSVLDVWEAERLEDVLGTGRTRPLVVECLRRATTPAEGEGQDPSAAEGGGRRIMVVKALGLPEVTQSSLCAELFGNLLARELGIDTPRPALVDLTPEFIQAAEPALSPWQLHPQPGLAAACEYFRGGFASAVPGAPLAPEELAQAARIYAFDLLVQNPDRRPEKPNCAQRGGQFVVYDFEMAFSFLLVIGQKDEAWDIAKHGLGPKHLFYTALRAVEIDWEPFLKDLARLSDDRLDWLEACMPESWRHWTARVRRHLVAVRMHLSEFAWELRRSLA